MDAFSIQFYGTANVLKRCDNLDNYNVENDGVKVLFKMVPKAVGWRSHPQPLEQGEGKEDTESQGCEDCSGTSGDW